MVSVLHKEPKYKPRGKAQVEEVGGYAAEDQKQIRTSNWGINHPGSVHTRFYSRDWLIKSLYLLVSNNKGEGASKRGVLINFLPQKRRGFFERGVFIIKRRYPPEILETDTNLRIVSVEILLTVWVIWVICFTWRAFMSFLRRLLHFWVCKVFQWNTRRFREAAYLPLPQPNVLS